jgi:mannosyl-oligosaccharide alpha-1,2-mannosidase
VDSLDALLVMGLDEEFRDALDKVRTVDFSTTHVRVVNVYETTVRFLGGLLGAHELNSESETNLDPDGVLMTKAKELGEMLYHAFDTENRMPLARFDWQRAAEGKDEELPAPYAIAAEIGSMGLEFTRLSQLTSDNRFYDAVQRVSDVLFREQSNGTKLPGMWPVVFNAQKESFAEESVFTLGGRADALYETIPKTYALLGGNSDQHKKMYLDFLETAQKNLFFKPMNPDNLDILLSGTVEIKDDKEAGTRTISLKPEGQHLSCFVGGMMALGSKIFSRPEDLPIAKKMVDGCVWAYDSTETGIMPEVFTAVAPVDGPGLGLKNKWDKKRWLQGITSMFPVSSPEEVKEAEIEARAEKIAESMRFPKGMIYIGDRRYILR